MGGPILEAESVRLSALATFRRVSVTKDRKDKMSTVLPAVDLNGSAALRTLGVGLQRNFYYSAVYSPVNWLFLERELRLHPGKCAEVFLGRFPYECDLLKCDTVGVSWLFATVVGRSWE